MALTCRGCRYLSSFGTFCLLGLEANQCREKRPRDNPKTTSDLILSQRLDSLVRKTLHGEAGGAKPFRS